MLAFIVIIHTIVSVGLILAILLHSGKGAGLSSALGGGAPSAFGGTGAIEKNLDRITIVLSLIFAFTTIILVAIVK